MRTFFGPRTISTLSKNHPPFYTPSNLERSYIRLYMQNTKHMNRQSLSHLKPSSDTHPRSTTRDKRVRLRSPLTHHIIQHMSIACDACRSGVPCRVKNIPESYRSQYRRNGAGKEKQAPQAEDDIQCGKHHELSIQTGLWWLGHNSYTCAACFTSDIGAPQN